MTTLKHIIVLFACAVMTVLSVGRVSARESSSDPEFRVKLDFNRWHDLHDLYADMKRLEKEWPDFLSLESIGKSHNGLDIMCMTVNNPATGKEEEKAGMYIEANIHGNEIQGGEVCLYTIWYLMENYGRMEDVTRLVDERVFYILPCVNPDGRQHFMDREGWDARTGQVPVDSDNDGLYDEDGPDDLNGNGVLEQVRKYVPGKGTHRISHLDKRLLEPVPYGESGDYILLGYEGIDNDNDGRINEDGPGGYDPNRNWGADWQPNYVQYGAMDYPFQLPESRAVNDFLMSRPNIAGVQSFHNSGGMILRGPGAKWQGEYPRYDIGFYDELAKNGERMLPFYRYLVIWSGLYSVHGGFIDWTNDGLGIISFSNELWSGRQYYTSTELAEQQKEGSSPISGRRSGFYFDDHLEFGDQFMEWEEYDHPEYGDVEIGGVWKKTRGRLPPRFMNEELCHRNMAFTLYQADEMPYITVDDVEVKKIGGDVYRVWIDITNDRIAPTITDRAAENHVVRPDLMLLDGGKKLEIISAGWIENREIQRVRTQTVSSIDQKNLSRIIVRNGMPGRTTKTLQYLVKGSGTPEFTYDSIKGGAGSVKIPLK